MLVLQKKTGTGTDYKSLIMADNPVGYWRLDETSGITAVDETGGLNGTYVDSPTLNQAALMTADGTAVDFNGSTQYVEVGHSAQYELDSAFTIEAWVKPETIGTGSSILGKQFNALPWSGWALRLLADGRFEFNIWQDLSLPATPQMKIYSTTTLIAGTKYYIAITGDGSLTAAGIELYINGALETKNIQMDNMTAYETLNAEFHIASDGGGDGVDRPFDGVIDEVALFNSELTVDRFLGRFTVGN